MGRAGVEGARFCVGLRGHLDGSDRPELRARRDHRHRQHRLTNITLFGCGWPRPRHRDCNARRWHRPEPRVGGADDETHGCRARSRRPACSRRVRRGERDSAPHRAQPDCRLGYPLSRDEVLWSAGAARAAIGDPHDRRRSRPTSVVEGTDLAGGGPQAIHFQGWSRLRAGSAGPADSWRRIEQRGRTGWVLASDRTPSGAAAARRPGRVIGII